MSGENRLGASFRGGSDLQEREPAILTTVEQNLGFHPAELMGRSSWWGSEAVGAFMYAGRFNDQDAVLKVQGIKPETSEIDMLRSFAAQQSALVRPPRLLAAKSWNEKDRYEALIIEKVSGPKLISRPTIASEVREFFRMFRNYRENCRNKPWVLKPDQSLSDTVAQNFADWRNASQKLYPDHPYRLAGDSELIDQGIELLQAGYQSVEPEFQHKHISTDDVFKVGDQYVLTSNLMWGWGAPFGDAVFAYHWYPNIIGNHVDGLSSDDIDAQKQIWLDEIWRLPKSGDEKSMLRLALLERAMAGLIIDSLTIPPEKPLARYIVESIRSETQQLLNEVTQDI
jgi:hypothetical protein